MKRVSRNRIVQTVAVCAIVITIFAALGGDPTEAVAVDTDGDGRDQTLATFTDVDLGPCVKFSAHTTVTGDSHINCKLRYRSGATNNQWTDFLDCCGQGTQLQHDGWPLGGLTSGDDLQLLAEYLDSPTNVVDIETVTISIP